MPRPDTNVSYTPLWVDYGTPFLPTCDIDEILSVTGTDFRIVRHDIGYTIPQLRIVIPGNEYTGRVLSIRSSFDGWVDIVKELNGNFFCGGFIEEHSTIWYMWRPGTPILGDESIDDTFVLFRDISKNSILRVGYLPIDATKCCDLGIFLQSRTFGTPHVALKSTIAPVVKRALLSYKSHVIDDRLSFSRYYCNKSHNFNAKRTLHELIMGFDEDATAYDIYAGVCGRFTFQWRRAISPMYGMLVGWSSKVKRSLFTSILQTMPKDTIDYRLAKKYRTLQGIPGVTGDRTAKRPGSVLNQADLGDSGDSTGGLAE